jgi:CxxC motif-containing protein (DUF1111 family)
MRIVLIFILVAACGCAGMPEPADTEVRVVAEDPTDNPVSGLTAEQMQSFLDGDALFDQRIYESQGLGPLYIRNSCGACHRADGRGPGFVEKIAVLDADGVPVAQPYGPTLRPYATAGVPLTSPDPSSLPPGHTLFVSRRLGPAVFGRGAIEAIADGEIERVFAEQDAAGEVSGRIHVVSYESRVASQSGLAPGASAIGRFGLKARIPTLDDFAADAFAGDMGMTSPMRPAEPANFDNIGDDEKVGLDLTLEQVRAVGDYTRMLALPRRAPADADGERLFRSVGCAACHVPALHTVADYPVAAYRDVDAFVYSDLLLHDMGDALEDFIEDGNASTREWRTAPLIGLRFFVSLMHDGRAKNADEAIRAHEGVGSEANPSVARFDNLTVGEKRQLVQFVSSL